MFDMKVWVSSLIFTSSLMTLLMCLYSINKKSVPLAREFSLLCGCSTMYSFGYAMELNNNNIDNMMFWNMFQVAGAEFIPILWLVIAAKFCGKDKIFTNFNKALILLMPLLMIIVRYTNSWHHLFYKNTYIISNGFFPVMFIEKGPLYIVNGAYITFSFVYSNILYLKFFLRYKGNYRYQSMLMFFASLFPYITHYLLLFNILPFGIDCIPFALTLSYILILIGLFKYQFFDVIPIAHYKVFQSIKDPIIVLDNKFKIVDFNIAASKAFLELDKNAAGKNLNKIMKKYNNLVQSILECKDAEIEIRKDNLTYFYYVKISVLQGENNNIVGFNVTLNDITKQVENMKKLQEMASTDGLTGLLNRRYFFECFENEFEQAKKYNHELSLIMFDVDNFKHINDNFGHQAGDTVLRNIVNESKKYIRSIDLFGRFGGEEFVIFLPNTSYENAKRIAEEIRNSIEKLDISFENKKIKATCSFGVTGVNTINKESPDLLVNFADKAMYEAKASGRNFVKLLPANSFS